MCVCGSPLSGPLGLGLERQVSAGHGAQGTPSRTEQHDKSTGAQEHRGTRKTGTTKDEEEEEEPLAPVVVLSESMQMVASFNRTHSRISNV